MGAPVPAMRHRAGTVGRRVHARLGPRRAAQATREGAGSEPAQILDRCARLIEALPPLAERSDFGGLSPRELDVERLVARGLTDMDIASELGCALRTVTTHVGRIRVMLGVDTRTAAAARARELDLL